MKNINFSSCVRVHEMLFFVSTDGYLMELDDLTGTTKIIIPRNLNELKITQIADKMLLIDNSVYFFESDGSLLYEYNYNTNYCSRYILPKLKMVDYKCFSGIYYFDKKIYMFTKLSGEIYSFDTIRKEIIPVFNSNKNNVICSIKIDENVYIANERKILKYSLKEHIYVEEINIDEDVLWMNTYNNYIYIMSVNQVIEYDKDFKTKRIIYADNESKREYNRIFITKNKFFLLPISKKEICVIDKENRKLSYEKEAEYTVETNINWSKYDGYCEDENYIWCDNRRTGYVLRIDKNNENIKWIEVKPTDVHEKFPYIKESINRKEIISESGIGLRGFINYILER